MPPVPCGDVDTHQIPQLSQHMGDGGKAVFIELGQPVLLICNALVTGRADKGPVGPAFVQHNGEILVNIQLAEPRQLGQDVMLRRVVHAGHDDLPRAILIKFEQADISALNHGGKIIDVVILSGTENKSTCTGAAHKGYICVIDKIRSRSGAESRTVAVSYTLITVFSFGPCAGFALPIFQIGLEVGDDGRCIVGKLDVFEFGGHAGSLGIQHIRRYIFHRPAW